MADTRAEAKGLPGPLLVGVEADRFAHAVSRWVDSGFDRRLAPYVWPDETTQRMYDLYDAWANRGYEDDSPHWPPRTQRGRLLHGKDADGRRTVSLESFEGYSPAAARITVWGLDGELDAELAGEGLGRKSWPKRAAPVEEMLLES